MIKLTKKIHLKALDTDHLSKALRWRNDYRVWKWCRQNDLISDLDHSQWFRSQNDDPKIKMFAVFGNDIFVGVCGLTDIDRVNQRAEFSLYIGPEYQGMGYGKLALKTLLMHGFRNLNLNCIWGETFDGNPAANMFESLGFLKEGTRRQFYYRNGKFIDAHLYSILREDFKCPLLSVVS